jgi:hypothetical protein
MKFSRGLLAGLMVVLAVPVSAQSLGEIAKKEQERRKTTPPAAKVYTNDDLKKIYIPGAVTAPTADQPAKPGDKDAAAKGVDAAKTDDAKAADKPDPAKDEATWRARMTGAREALGRLEMFRDALQSQINGLTADFTARDDPYQRAQIADQRQKALAELAQVGKDIDTAKKQIAGIEEEARRANVPAGWIR